MAWDSAYYSSVNEDLLRFIPPDSNRVLEVGCGTGALASRFKRINPKCVYWGVEADQDAGEAAHNNPDLDIMFSETIEHFLGRYPTECENPDCVVFGDCLEHLVDPHAVLKKCVEWLKPNGSVVACVPNVQHWSVIQTLIQGQWPRMGSGLFDATHLSWFTKQSLIEMFEAAGLTIAKIVPRNIAPGGERLIDAVKEFGLTEDVGRFREGCQAYQWLIHAVKGDVPSRKVLIRGFTAEGCCARPRLTEPGGMINTIPGFRYSEVTTQVEPGESVVVVRQRFNITEAAIREHLKHGQLIIGEWDDDPWYEGFNGKLKTPSVEWALKACHAIQVSTEAIAELVRPINPNVAVFPNQIAAVGPEREYVESDVIRVYLGGQRNKGDWDKVIPFVNGMSAASPDVFHFVVVHDRDLYQALETHRKTFYAFQPYEKYRAILRTCDVTIASLANTRFNRCKSDITVIECAVEGVAVIPCNPESSMYTELRSWKYNKKPSEFAESLRSQGRRDRSWSISNRMLCDHYKKRAAWYDGLLDDKAELDRQLFERLPELRPT
ncbi:MAG: methyltransferase domain-containing protein [Candidatus Pacebacteria bacterium]|nr:methyltransferase domain-containing protein [Candidatus Paceibacterota bacterium]